MCHCAKPSKKRLLPAPAHRASGAHPSTSPVPIAVESSWEDTSEDGKPEGPQVGVLAMSQRQRAVWKHGS